MKICMFTNTYTPHVGGVARSVIFFAEDLRDMGNEVLIIAPTFPDMDSESEENDDIFRVPALQQFNGSDFSVRIPVPFMIDNRLESFQPDIIHSHHPYLLGDAALRASKKYRLPLIFTHHTRYEEYTHYVSKDSDVMKTFAIHLSTEYANLCTKVVAPSDSIAHLIRSRGVETVISEIPTGVDMAFFEKGNGQGFRKCFNIPKDAFLIGHLGRLAPEKNLEFLTRALSQCLKDMPEARFLVVGEGPSERQIKSIFKEKGLSDRLIMTGKQTGRNLADAYHAMDIFTFASKSETQGMVITEAMASGLPVVALDGPGVREVLKNDINGYLLEGDSSQHQFAEALTRVFREPETIERMSASARKTAAYFDRKVCAEKLYDLYMSAVKDFVPDTPIDTDVPEAWDKFLLTIQTEWELISQKAKAVIKTVGDESPY